MEFIKPCIECTIDLTNISEEVVNDIKKNYEVVENYAIIPLSDLENKYDNDIFVGNIVYDFFDEIQLEDSILEYIGTSHQKYLATTISSSGNVNSYMCGYNIVELLNVLTSFSEGELIELHLIRCVDDKAIYCKSSCFRTGISEKLWIIGLSQTEVDILDEIEYNDNDEYNCVEDYIEHIINCF